MAGWLEAGYTMALLLFVFAAYFASAESAGRDLRSTVALLWTRKAAPRPVAELVPAEPESGVTRT